MKIRNGFVSNSSSSSFVVAFDCIPQTVEELQKMLYGDAEYIPSSWSVIESDKKYSTRELAEIVFRDMQNQKPNDRVRIMDALEGDFNIDYDDYKNEDGSINWEAYQEDVRKVIELSASKFIQENSGKFIYTFDFSDNGGGNEAMLEHGYTFKNLNYKSRSNH